MSWQRSPKHCSLSRSIQKMEDDLGTGACVYLSVLQQRPRDTEKKVNVLQRSRRNLAQERCYGTERGVPPVGASDGIGSLHVCAAFRCPHLRQTHVVLIHRIQADSFSPSFPSTKTSLVTLHLFIISTFYTCDSTFTIHSCFCQQLFNMVSPNSIYFILFFFTFLSRLIFILVIFEIDFLGPFITECHCFERFTQNTMFSREV